MPASLLAVDGSIGYGGAAPAAFMAKQGYTFTKYTFLIPARSMFQAVNPQDEDHYIHSAQIMLAQ